jgi:hypothetical protein
MLIAMNLGPLQVILVEVHRKFPHSLEANV